MKKGFTLIELLIVIVILGILAAFISGNFFSSLKKGRDVRRKADLSSVKKALEMYYEDHLVYPDGLVWGSPLIDDNGKIIRLSPKEIRTMGRQAKGVRLVRLDKTQKLSTIASFEEGSEEELKSSDSNQSNSDVSSADTTLPESKDAEEKEIKVDKEEKTEIIEKEKAEEDDSKAESQKTIG